MRRVMDMPAYTWLAVSMRQPFFDRSKIVPTDSLTFGPVSPLCKCKGKRLWRRRSMRASQGAYCRKEVKE